MKKIILVLCALCLIAPAGLAHTRGFGPDRDVADRNTFEVNPQILQEIEAARNNPSYQNQQQSYQNQQYNSDSRYPTADEYAQQYAQSIKNEPLQSKTLETPKGKKNKNVKLRGQKKGVRFRGQGSSPAQTQYHFGRPDYGYRQNY